MATGGQTSMGWQGDLTVCERNWYMFENELETNVTFQVSSPLDATKVERVRAHRYMLIAASPVFWAMLCGELKEDGEIIVPDVAPDAFREMLRFIYTDNVTINGQNVMQLLHAAKKYQLSALVKRCATFLDNELQPSNACSILNHCQFFGENELGKKCLEKIEQNTEDALASEGFLTISKETLGVILDSNQLAIEEVDIFKRTQEWALNNTDETRSVRAALGKNINKIRFPIMAAKEFNDDVCTTNVLNECEQLQILRYTTDPDISPKPDAFCCEPRVQMKNKEAKRDDVIKEGDRVRVIKAGRYDGIQLRGLEVGTCYGRDWNRLIVKLDRLPDYVYLPPDIFQKM